VDPAAACLCPPPRSIVPLPPPLPPPAPAHPTHPLL
jgi:hypothetical protein